MQLVSILELHDDDTLALFDGDDLELVYAIIAAPSSTDQDLLDDPCTDIMEEVDVLATNDGYTAIFDDAEEVELLVSVVIDTCDDAIGEQVASHVTTGGRRAADYTAADYWVFIDEIRTPGVKIGTLTGGRDLGARGTLRFTMVRTPDTAFDIPSIGASVKVSWQDHLQWGGMIENVRQTNRAGSHNTVLDIEVECASWERLAEKRLTNHTYTNQSTQTIFRALLTDYLAAEDIVEGVIDAGLTLTMAGPRTGGDYIRVSEFLRDVAEASGGVHDIDPFKRLNFFKTTVGTGGLLLRNVVALHEAQSGIERQDYRNVQRVTVRGTGSTVTEFIRENEAEITARQVVEGGTGRHEAAEQFSHPTSDDPAECGRLAVAIALVRLNSFGFHQRNLTARMNLPKYRLGDIVTVDMPEHDSGTYQLASLRLRAVHDRMFADLTLIQTSVLQRAFQGWMKMAQAGRAVVQIPGTPVFTNLVTFMSTESWIVPDANGDGSDVEVSFDARGAGGGGTAAWKTQLPNAQPPTQYPECPGFPFLVYYPETGVSGHAGGRGIAFRELPVGTVVTVVVGDGGAGSSFACDPELAPNPATNGSHTWVAVDGVVIAQGNGGGGGATGQGAGTGSGDFAETGAGTAGGLGGAIRTGAGLQGTDGYVEIRY